MMGAYSVSLKMPPLPDPIANLKALVPSNLMPPRSEGKKNSMSSDSPLRDFQMNVTLRQTMAGVPRQRPVPSTSPGPKNFERHGPVGCRRSKARSD